MKKIITLFVLLTFTMGLSQLNEVNSHVNKIERKAKNDSIKNGWFMSGDASVLMSQSAFFNWVAGGVNNISGSANLTYEANYINGDFTWDNMVALGYGLTKNEGQGLRKTDDRIELNTLVGKKAWEYWSYSFFGNIRTQFSNGFDYENDTEQKYPISGFLKPMYLTFGPGMYWKKRENLKFNLAPLTSKMTLINGEVFQENPKYDPNDINSKPFLSSNEIDLYGIPMGTKSKYELGFYASGFYKTEVFKNVTVKNILALYSNYLENPQNIDIDYTTSIDMQVNKYLSTMLTLQLVYDDDAYEALQVREVFGVGVTAKF